MSRISVQQERAVFPVSTATAACHICSQSGESIPGNWWTMDNRTTHTHTHTNINIKHTHTHTTLRYVHSYPPLPLPPPRFPLLLPVCVCACAPQSQPEYYLSRWGLEVTPVP